jgi:hypothetical protein
MIRFATLQTLPIEEPHAFQAPNRPPRQGRRDFRARCRRRRLRAGGEVARVGPVKQHGDVGMTLRAVVSACCGIFVLLASAQARGVECATETQRKIEIESLNESVDWFLSIVEEVPEGIARQFGAAKGDDEKVFRQAIAHPLWRAHKVREAGDNIKRAHFVLGCTIHQKIASKR